MKDALREKEADQSLKTKTRERVQPKMGKLEVDYQKLYDAFFRFQTKPPLSIYGETYYEGKEFETKFKERKPGDLSQELKEALAFYKTAVGRKLIEHEPKILEKSMGDVQAWANKLSEEIVSKMRGEMKKKGHNI